MDERYAAASLRAEPQRGFTLLDVLVAAAILSTMVLAFGTFGARSPAAHPAALALQAALVEARAVALTTGDAAEPLVPTGATVAVAPDPLDASGAGSVIRVYRSRPILYRGPGPAQGTPAAPLLADVGFPEAHVPATFRLSDATLGTVPAPFTILISHSGYASIVANYAYDPASPRTFMTDPGCDESGVTIAADDRSRVETHPFLCREGVLQIDDPHAAP